MTALDDLIGDAADTPAGNLRRTLAHLIMDTVGHQVEATAAKQLLDRVMFAAGKAAPLLNEHVEDECGHHSWDGLMALLDEHWPDDIFPTVKPDSPGRDPGPRIISLLRWIDHLKAEPLHGGQQFTYEPSPGVQYLCEVAERAPEQFRALASEPTAWLMLRWATPVPAVPADPVVAVGRVLCGAVQPGTDPAVSCTRSAGHLDEHRNGGPKGSGWYAGECSRPHPAQTAIACSGRPGHLGAHRNGPVSWESGGQTVRCDLGHPNQIGKTCDLAQGHDGDHRHGVDIVWTDRPCYMPHPTRPESRGSCLLPLGHVEREHRNGMFEWV